MGRMLEALKTKDTNTSGFRDKAFFEDTFEHVSVTDSPMSTEDNIPFIEVGPNKKMEGSAQVMAFKHAAQPRVQPPHQSVEKIAVRPAGPIEPAMPTLSARTMAVAFEPWPASPQLGQGIAPEIITFHHPEHPVSRQYVNLAMKMQEGRKPGTSQVVLLTGSRSQVGTSTVLLNLAVAAAQTQAAEGNLGRVVVVDANWRRPSLAQRLGYFSAAGLQDVLLGRLALEQAVVQTSVAGLHLLPGQSVGEGRPLKPEAVRWLFNWLGEHFSLVLVDGPPPEESNELSVLTSACDGVYLVLPEGENPQAQRSLAQTLSSMGPRMRGLFHTHADV